MNFHDFRPLPAEPAPPTATERMQAVLAWAHKALRAVRELNGKAAKRTVAYREIMAGLADLGVAEVERKRLWRMASPHYGKQA